jgi:hypothetical protein
VEAEWKDVTDLDGQQLFDGGYEGALDWIGLDWMNSYGCHRLVVVA